MKRHGDSSLPLTLPVLLVLATGAATVAAAGEDPGAVLLGHELRDLDGAPASLEAHAGEVLVVNFWASWCAPCRKELPLLDAWNTAWQDRGARVVAVSIDEERRNARRLVKELELELTALHDGPDGLAAQLDLAAVPSTYLLDRAGCVVMVICGSEPEQLEALRREVESRLATEPGRRS